MNGLAETLLSLPFPEEMAVNRSEAEVARCLYQLSLLTKRLTPPFAAADLGAGWGTFPVACAEAGIDISAVDDYRDHFDSASIEGSLNVLRRHGVKLIKHDLFSGPLPFAEESLDAICSFHSMEHWHQSPKKLFAQCMKILRPGGVFLLSGPNCVNLRKRLTVPLGYGKWTQMLDWYEVETFRSHVREPDVDDLRYIARDMGLVNVEIYGRNFLGMGGRNFLTRTASRALDPLLRLRPSLCSDIYLLGNKPNV